MSTQNNLPAGPRPRRRRNTRRGDLPGSGLLHSSLLSMAQESCVAAGLGRCVPDQRRVRHSPRRPRVRLPVHRRRRRATRLWPAVIPGAGVCLVSSGSGACSPRIAARPAQRTAGARRPRHSPLHRHRGRPALAHRHQGTPTSEGKLYLCAIKDVFSNCIVGYSIDQRMTYDLAVNTLSHAIVTRKPTATNVHSDRGSQFRSRKYVATLAARFTRINGPSRSLRRQRRDGIPSSPYSKKVLDRKRGTTRAELRLAIVTWIERTYHRRRHQAPTRRPATYRV